MRNSLVLINCSLPPGKEANSPGRAWADSKWQWALACRRHPHPLHRHALWPGIHVTPMVSLASTLCHCPHFRHTLGEWRTPQNLHALVPSLAYKPESAEVTWVWVWIPVPAMLVLWQEQFVWLRFSCFVLPKMGAKVALLRVTVRLLENMFTECFRKWCPVFVVSGYSGLRLHAGCWEWWRQALEAGLLPVSGAQAARQWACGAGWEDTWEVLSMPQGDPPGKDC